MAQRTKKKKQTSLDFKFGNSINSKVFQRLTIDVRNYSALSKITVFKNCLALMKFKKISAELKNARARGAHFEKKLSKASSFQLIGHFYNCLQINTLITSREEKILAF